VGHQLFELCSQKRQDIAKQRTYGTTILSTPRNTSISKLNTTNPGIASKTNNQLQKVYIYICIVFDILIYYLLIGVFKRK